MLRALSLSAALLAPAAAMAAMAMPASTYVAKAGAGDLFEIRSSKLVLASTNPKLHAFAAQMIKDHTDSTDMVKAAVAKAGMKAATPMLNADQTAMIAKLEAAHGSARDALYIADQKTAHQQALMLHEGYAADGKVPSLKMTAAKIVPVVKGHIRMLDAM